MASTSSSHANVAGMPLPTADAIINQHQRLEQALDASLCAVVSDTENSAVAIIQHVRRLHDSASKLVAYLDGTSFEGGDLSQELVASVAFLADFGAFIQRLQPKLERDREHVQAVVAEIKELDGMAEAVKIISMQSHMLGINAAIEASRAGAAGSSFAVIAVEIRQLAKDSGATAARIGKGLARARQVVEDQMSASLSESSAQMHDAANAAGVIDRLRGNFEGLGQYYKTRFAVVTKHNEELAADIAEVLGQIQYQDVVRQSIERVRIAVSRRNEILQAALADLEQGAQGFEQLPQQLELILEDYLAEEDHHRHSTRQVSAATGELKVELF
jgi:methyl-accepting chemotaxis protein